MNNTSTTQFTKEQLLAKISEIVNESLFIPKELIESAKKLSYDQVEKLLIMLYVQVRNEKSLNEKDKEKIWNILSDFAKWVIQISKKVLGKARKENEWNNKKEEEVYCENLLNSI